MSNQFCSNETLNQDTKLAESKKIMSNNSHCSATIDQNTNATFAENKNSSFDIRDYQDQLKEDSGKQTIKQRSYLCPVCGAENFKINQTNGKYGTFSCGCARTSEGKKQIRDTIAPIKYEKTPRPDFHYQFPYYDIDGNPLIRANVLYQGGKKQNVWQEYWVNGRFLTPKKAEEKGLTIDKKDYQSQLTPYDFHEIKDEQIFITEGETCCQALKKLGITATTNIMGTGEWRDQYSKQLKDKGVKEAVVLPDRDKVGIKHADQVAESLGKYGIKLSWLYAYPDSGFWNNPPESKGLDIKDYLEDYPMSKDDLLNLVEAHRRQFEFTYKKETIEPETLSDTEIIRKMVHAYITAEDTAEKIVIKSKLFSQFKIGKDDLNQLIDEARGIKPKTKQSLEILNAENLFNGDEIGIKWLIPGLLPKGGVTILGANSGDGKTTLAYDCAGAVTFAEEFLGEKPTKQGKVLILSSDEPKNFAIDKLANRGFSKDDNLLFVPHWTIDHWEILEKAMEEHKPDLVIIDSFNSIHSNDNFDSNSDRAAITLNRLNPLLEDHDSACILIHHLNKDKENKGVNKLRNSTAIAAASSMIWLMSGEGEVKNFTLAKTRGTEPLSLKIKMDAPSGKFNLVEGTVYDDESKSLAERIQALFKEKYPDQRLEFEEIKAEITAKDDGLRKALGRLVKADILNKGKSTRNKKKSVWYLKRSEDVEKHSPPPSSQSSCPNKPETPINTKFQTLDDHWTDVGNTGRSLDKDIEETPETSTSAETQTLDGQNNGQGERERSPKVSTEESYKVTVDFPACGIEDSFDTSLDKDIEQTPETFISAETQTLDGQNGGQGERDCLAKVSNNKDEGSQKVAVDSLDKDIEHGETVGVCCNAENTIFTFDDYRTAVNDQCWCQLANVMVLVLDITDKTSTEQVGTIEATKIERTWLLKVIQHEQNNNDLEVGTTFKIQQEFLMT